MFKFSHYTDDDRKDQITPTCYASMGLFILYFSSYLPRGHVGMLLRILVSCIQSEFNLDITLNLFSKKLINCGLLMLMTNNWSCFRVGSFLFWGNITHIIINFSSFFFVEISFIRHSLTFLFIFHSANTTCCNFFKFELFIIIIN